MTGFEIAVATLLPLLGYATGKWHYWRREAMLERQAHVRTLKDTRTPFVRPIDRDIAEFERVKRGDANVLPFRKPDQ